MFWQRWLVVMVLVLAMVGLGFCTEPASKEGKLVATQLVVVDKGLTFKEMVKACLADKVHPAITEKNFPTGYELKNKEIVKMSLLCFEEVDRTQLQEALKKHDCYEAGVGEFLAFLANATDKVRRLEPMTAYPFYQDPNDIYHWYGLRLNCIERRDSDKRTYYLGLASAAGPRPNREQDWCFVVVHNKPPQ